MAKLNADNERIMIETRLERDVMLKEARITKETIINEAKNEAKKEADKIMQHARESITAEKDAALAELKSQVANLSIELAEKILKSELSSADKQKVLMNNLTDNLNFN